MPWPTRSLLLNRRSVVRAACAVTLAAPWSLAACASNERVYEMRAYRDAGCGCCRGWATLLQRSGRFRVSMTDETDMPALKRRLSVPEDLASCHTAEVEGMVIEGHVPADDIVRLLAERPSGIRGLAVPGMPLGSPGMEQPDGSREAIEVIAFRTDGGRNVFARHEA